MATVLTSPFLKIEVVNGKALFSPCMLPAISSACTRTSLQNRVSELLTRVFYPQFHTGYYHIYGDSLRGYYITLDGLMSFSLG